LLLHIQIKNYQSGEKNQASPRFPIYLLRSTENIHEKCGLSQFVLVQMVPKEVGISARLF